MISNLWLSWVLGCSGGSALIPPDPEAPSEAVDPDRIFVHGGGPVVERTCEASEEAWVMRAMPLLWGRKPHGAAEVGLWASVAREHGRDVVVRAMALDPEYQEHWLDWFTDALYTARTGDKEYDSCFESPNLSTHDGQLTQFLRTTGPTGGSFGSSFNMADVIVDALVADDVSTIYQVNLFSRMNKPVVGANVSQQELEYNRRVNFGELFYRTYLGRNMVCMGCHNSEFSVTDHPDPKLDRTWQLPGLFEAALLGESAGRDVEEAYAIFRYRDVVNDSIFGGGGRAPWDMSTSCGRFESPGSLPDRDFIDQDDAYFIEAYGPGGSIYDIERDLAEGVDALQGQGLKIATDGSVAGPDAFAYLVASNIADQVWAEATGAYLTVAHHFPRNEAQMTRLKQLADVLAQSGFSLTELLVAVTADPYFNPGLPQSCESLPYGMDPVFDPWTISEEDPHRRRNGVGDAAHRLHARALLRTTHANLMWRPRGSWLGYSGGAEEDFQSAIGVFLRESAPGHNGSDFQGILSWEREYGACDRAPLSGGDAVTQLASRAVSQGATVREVVHAIKDRLTSTGLDPEEEPLIEALLGVPLDQVVRSDPALLRGLRLYCGAVLMSPGYQLVTDVAVGEIPSLALGRRDDCQRIASLVTASGTPITCDGTRLR